MAIIASRSDGTCLICPHAIGNHAWNGKINYQCQLCSCDFSYNQYSDHITVINDALGLMKIGTEVMIKDILNSNLDSNLSPDAPLEPGGLQSLLNLRFDLLDTKAIFQLAGILDYGAKKYGENNWRKISVESHLNHALVHIFAYLQHDTQDDHLGHAFCRLMFALGTEEKGDI